MRDRQGEMDVDCRVPQRVMEGKEGRRETAYSPSDEDDGAADKERDNSSTMARSSAAAPLSKTRAGWLPLHFPRTRVNY